MALKRITDLVAASTLIGDELLEVSQLSTTETITATTISAQASDNSYNDSGTGFVSAGFAVGDRVKVVGFTGSAANNIVVGVITALTSAKMTIGGTDGDVIVDDAAGESVTIAKWTSKRATLSDIGIGGGGGGISDAPSDGNLYGRQDAAWEIVPGSAPAKFFARLSKIAATTVPASTNTIISWDNEVLDNGGFYDAGSPTRLTIPAGITEVVVEALLRAESPIGSGSSDFVIEIFKNGSTFVACTIDNQFWGPPPISTGVIPVVEGDYFEVRTWCNSSFPLNEGACYFSVHGIGTATTVTSATILQNTTAPDEYFVTGPDGNGYASIEAARDQMVTDGENAGFHSPAKIKVLTRSLTIASTITLPQYCSVIAENTRIRFTGATGAVFDLGGYNRIKGLEFCGGNASNTEAVINCGDNTDISILECHLYGNDTDNFMKFMKASGTNFTRLNAERCLINHRGLSGYAFRFNNTGSGSRFCDCWFENVFSDTYSALTGFGGNFESVNCKDMRLKRSTIRGSDAEYTGLRLSGASCSWHLSQCNFDAVPGGSQPGFDIYAVTGARLDYGAVSAKKTGFETGSTIVALSTDLIGLDVV